MGVEIASEVAGADHVAEPEVPDIRHQVAGVVAAEDRVEEDPVELAVDAAGGVEVTRARRVDRLGIGEVQRDAELERRVALAQRLHGEAVAEHGGAAWSPAATSCRPGACAPAV